MKKRQRIDEKGAQEINEAMEGKHPRHVYKRLLVLSLKGKGMTNREIARIAEFNETSVSKIVKRYLTEGIEAIVGIRHNHGNRYMSNEQEREFLKQFSTMGEAGKVIEVTEIHRAFEKAVGHPVTKSAIYYLLHKHGWRKVMPRSKHPKKASNEEIEAYKKNQGTHPVAACRPEKTTSDVSGRGWVWADQQAQKVLVPARDTAHRSMPSYP